MRSPGTLADFADLDGRTSLRELVVDQLAAHASDYDLGAVTAAYRTAVNSRLATTVNPDAELLIDEDDQVAVDDRVDGDLRELLDDALFTVDLQKLAEHHRRPCAADTATRV
ncbi:hypothetical protein [Saccharothrix lopnurensis]|uniref:Uncharacterized protein n=1 Tax=Saccharothrix lopnurensis TaxID=1670621 RepID=A0ABW1PI13_9PSEU